MSIFIKREERDGVLYDVEYEETNSVAITKETLLREILLANGIASDVLDALIGVLRENSLLSE